MLILEKRVNWVHIRFVLLKLNIGTLARNSK